MPMSKVLLTMPRLRWSARCSAFRGCGTSSFLSSWRAFLPRPIQTRRLGRDRRLSIGGLVLVNDALRRRLVQGPGGGVRQLGGLGVLTSIRGFPEPTNRSLQRRLRRLVTLTSLLVGLDSFELGFDVRHGRPLELLSDVWGTAVQRDGPRYQRCRGRAKFEIASEDVCCESRVRAAAGPH